MEDGWDGLAGGWMDVWERLSNGSNFDAVYVCMVYVYGYIRVPSFFFLVWFGLSKRFCI